MYPISFQMNAASAPIIHKYSTRLSLTGLIGLCVGLVISSMALTRFWELHLTSLTNAGAADKSSAVTAQRPEDKSPPWGELETQDIKLQQPGKTVSAVLARIRLHPDSDLDKLIGYWAAVPGVRAKDLRPLLESVKETPDGGIVSLLYFLPPFARDSLYTSPISAPEDGAKTDCHWSAMNFFNDKPDPRFQDDAYASAYITEHCYQIGKPSMCGDLVFLVNGKGEVLHSAVYIADDLVLTKNGTNVAQPWILTRLPKLREILITDEDPKILYYRRKEA